MNGNPQLLHCIVDLNDLIISSSAIPIPSHETTQLHLSLSEGEFRSTSYIAVGPLPNRNPTMTIEIVVPLNSTKGDNDKRRNLFTYHQQNPLALFILHWQKFIFLQARHAVVYMQDTLSSRALGLAAARIEATQCAREQRYLAYKSYGIITNRNLLSF